MYDSCLKKQEALKAEFASCETAEAKYQKIIELGKQNPGLSDDYKVPANLVKGCQSTMHLHAYLEDGKVEFESESDALISNGLAVLLTRVYGGEAPETILKCPPSYLEDIGVNASLTLNRANGLASMFLHMKQAALKLLVDSERSQ